MKVTATKIPALLLAHRYLLTASVLMPLPVTGYAATAKSVGITHKPDHPRVGKVSQARTGAATSGTSSVTTMCVSGNAF
ncbi:hypothetical protein [Acetobacter musti]|uniref:hypothetical protein n=1 Tax=Acetobacter musti TaxID=864732 RepID=UPI00156B5785|nr:hypothetical protein [Acetobacter musti]